MGYQICLHTLPAIFRLLVHTSCNHILWWLNTLRNLSFILRMWFANQQRRNAPFSSAPVTLVWHLKTHKLLLDYQFHFSSVWTEKQKKKKRGGQFFQVSLGRERNLLEDKIHAACGLFESLVVCRNFLLIFCQVWSFIHKITNNRIRRN